ARADNRVEGPPGQLAAQLFRRRDVVQAHTADELTNPFDGFAAEDDVVARVVRFPDVAAQAARDLQSVGGGVPLHGGDRLGQALAGPCFVDAPGNESTPLARLRRIEQTAAEDLPRKLFALGHRPAQVHADGCEVTWAQRLGRDSIKVFKGDIGRRHGRYCTRE